MQARLEELVGSLAGTLGRVKGQIGFAQHIGGVVG
jgi:hypothetical protein